MKDPNQRLIDMWFSAIIVITCLLALLTMSGCTTCSNELRCPIGCRVPAAWCWSNSYEAPDEDYTIWPNGWWDDPPMPGYAIEDTICNSSDDCLFEYEDVE